MSENVRFMATTMTMQEYFDILTEIKNTIEVFADAEKFSTDNEGVVYIWGEFTTELTEKTIIKAIENIHPAAKVILNPDIKEFDWGYHIG